MCDKFGQGVGSTLYFIEHVLWPICRCLFGGLHNSLIGWQTIKPYDPSLDEAKEAFFGCDDQAVRLGHVLLFFGFLVARQESQELDARAVGLKPVLIEVEHVSVGQRVADNFKTLSTVRRAIVLTASVAIG